MWRCVDRLGYLPRIKSGFPLAGTGLSVYLLSMLPNARSSYHLHIRDCIIAALLSNVQPPPPRGEQEYLPTDSIGVT